MLFNILWSACLYTLQIITHMFHKVSAREEKRETCAWLTMCESPEQANRRVLTALPPDTKNFFFILKTSSIQGRGQLPLTQFVLKTKNLECERKKIPVGDDVLSQESEWCPALLQLTLLSTEA